MAIINGTEGADSLSGTIDPDTISGFDGDDTISGGKGTDRIDAGAGDDLLAVVIGDVGVGERIDGGTGTDTLRVGGPNDFGAAKLLGLERMLITSAGGNGGVALLTAKQFAGFEAIEGVGAVGASAAGRFDLAAVAAGIRFLGSAGGDSITGRDGADDITAGAGADRIQARDGADVIRIGRFDVGLGETISGGAGSDTVVAAHLADLAPAASFEGIEVLQTGGRVFLTAAQLASLERVENVGVGFVEVTGAAAATFALSKVLLGPDVRFIGSAGADTVLGSKRADDIQAGAGADSVAGGKGDDIVRMAGTEAAAGEVLDGGKGTDTLRIDSTADISAATITGFERLLTNQSTPVTLTAAQLAGFAEVDGTSTLVRLVAASAGTYDLTGKVATDEVGLTGSAGADLLVAAGAADTVAGGNGADTLDGAGGADSLTGGVGDDVFLLRQGQAGGDRIGDFAGAGAAGGDMLELRGYGPGVTLTSLGGSLYRITSDGHAPEEITVQSGGALLGAGDLVVT